MSEQRLSDIRQKLSPEWKLLCIASRIQLDSGEKDTLSQLCRSNINWNIFLNLVKYHGVCNLVSSNLLNINQKLVQKNVEEELRQIRTKITTHCLYLQKKLLDVYNLLEHYSIPLIPIKGITLSQVIYGDTITRHSRDLDILVKQNDLMKCDEILLKNNYIRIDPTLDFKKIPENNIFRMFHHLNYMTPDKKGFMDVHWCLSEFPYLPGDIYFNANEIGTVRISNKDIKLVSLQDILLYLLIHCANSPRQRLIWLSDIANIFRLHGNKINFSEVYDQAGYLQLTRPVEQTMFLLNLLFSTPYPAILTQDRVVKDVSLKLMIKITYIKLLTDPDKIGTRKFNLKKLIFTQCHRFLLIPGLAHKYTYFKKILQPGVCDYPAWLPARLYFLAYLFRPFGIISRRLK